MDCGLDLFAMAAALTGESDTEGGNELEQVERGEHLVAELVAGGDSDPDGLLQHVEARASVAEQSGSGNGDSDNAQLDAETLATLSRLVAERRPGLVSNATDGWKSHGWDVETLVDMYGELQFSLFNGQQFPLADYAKYIRNRAQVDAEPLYLFEDLSLVHAEHLDNPKHTILKSYRVPAPFQPDLFATEPQEEAPQSQVTQPESSVTNVPEQCASKLASPAGDQAATGVNDGCVRMDEGRPRFRWLLVGPPRSGSRVHIDPLATGAWNALVSGTKRWALIHPSVSMALLDQAQTSVMQSESDATTTTKPVSSSDTRASVSAIEWFGKVLPYLRELLRDAGLPAPVEFTQRPGQLVYVPAGYWHTVLNLSTSVCITENFASPHDLSKVHHVLKREAPRYCNQLWLPRLMRLSPERFGELVPTVTAAVVDRHGISKVDEVTLPRFDSCMGSVRARMSHRKPLVGWERSGKGNIDEGKSDKYDNDEEEEEEKWLKRARRSYELYRQSVLYTNNRRKLDEDIVTDADDSTRDPRGDIDCSHIPRILHHIWLGGDVPPEILERRARWKAMHPGWTLVLWTDERVEAALASGELYLRSPKSYFDAPNYGAKSDVLRYHLLHQVGGVYVDTDFECVRPLDTLMQPGTTWFAGLSNVAGVEVNNGIMAAVPGHRILEGALQTLERREDARNGNCGGGFGDSLQDPAQRLHALVSGIAGGFLESAERSNLARAVGVCSSTTLNSTSAESLSVHRKAMRTITETGPGLLSTVVLRGDGLRPGEVLFPPTIFHAMPNDVHPDQARASWMKYKRPESVAVHLYLRSWMPATAPKSESNTTEDGA